MTAGRVRLGFVLGWALVGCGAEVVVIEGSGGAGGTGQSSGQPSGPSSQSSQSSNQAQSSQSSAQSSVSSSSGAMDPCDCYCERMTACNLHGPECKAICAGQDPNFVACVCQLNAGDCEGVESCGGDSGATTSGGGGGTTQPSATCGLCLEDAYPSCNLPCDDACQAQLDCANDCGWSESCWNQCAANSPGEPQARAVISCLVCDHCPNECSGWNAYHLCN